MFTHVMVGAKGVPDDPDGAYDFGLGAGFYVDAVEPPFSTHYKMRSYIESELPALIAAEFPADMSFQSIMGHSMGGHGALTIGLRNPDVYRSISAFSPIVSPLNCPWGEKALTGYLGSDKAVWREYDACALVEDGARAEHILIDQGLADDFLKEQLMPERFRNVCEAYSQPLSLREHAGYDHSYFFISSFMKSQIIWHSQYLKG